ncbi:tetratricopeptide repeat protein 4 [Protopterus annectens]|uniref:tetratricopeptide repeat protein 4 n=1 Tax=Protopterus annectens TaxID=7888 RepID=UPI001CFBD4CE|nr:tetratricopeptide repeat protein 4 [Protopterus annectens]
MASQSPEDEDYMDAFMDKFKTEKYEGGFNEDTWEEEIEKIPMFMKKVPTEIDPEKNPDLACLQAMIYDEDRPPEDQAKTYKDDGNYYFKEKKYKQAVASYTEGLKKKCSNQEVNAILYTNRAAAQFHLGNHRSALNDVIVARKLKPDHLKAFVRGVLCHIELKNFSEAVQWCDNGLKIDPKEKQLLELRTKADKLKRAKERDARKARLKEKKQLSEKEVLLRAIKDKKIKIFNPHCGSSDEDEEDRELKHLSELSLAGLDSEIAVSSTVFLNENGNLVWPVLILYPEYGQTDFISAFNEESRFIDHLHVMFGQELPPWDIDHKYLPTELELYFEDVEREEMYQINAGHTLLQVLQHKRYFVRNGTPSFIVLVRSSPFLKQYLTGRNVHIVK